MERQANSVCALHTFDTDKEVAIVSTSEIVWSALFKENLAARVEKIELRFVTDNAALGRQISAH